MQGDVPEAVLRPRDVPHLWRSLGLAQQAQALRCWVSRAEPCTPLEHTMRTPPACILWRSARSSRSALRAVLGAGLDAGGDDAVAL